MAVEATVAGAGASVGDMAACTDAAPGELAPEPGGAEAGRLGAHIGVGEAGVGEQAELDQTVEFGADLFLAAEGAQLAGQLGAGVLPRGEAAKSPFMQGARHGRRSAQAASTEVAGGMTAISGNPTATRILFSISRAMCGLARRNSRTLSLPWPIFSPL